MNQFKCIGIKCWRFSTIGTAILSGILVVGCNAQEQSNYPVLSSGLTVPGMPEVFSVNKFRWLNDHQIVTLTVDRIDSAPEGENIRAGWQIGLKLWDIADNTVKGLAEPKVGGLCVADDVIRYWQYIWANEREQPVAYYAGKLGHLEKTGDPGLKNFREWKSCLPQSAQPLPEWARDIPDVNIRQLRPEHGFLVIDRDSIDSVVRGVYLYSAKSNKNEGKEIFGLMGVAPGAYLDVEPEYYKFKDAYLVDYIGKGIPAYWLYPDGRVERVFSWGETNIDLRITKRAGPGRLIPTKKLSPISDVHTSLVGPLTDEGLYSYADPHTPVRLVKGRIDQESIAVSPDGCRVAFMNDDRPYIEHRKPKNIYQLQVINLCHKEPAP